jgi:dephospho-CoA kinase
MQNKKRLLIGITGGLGAGKSIAGTYFESHGYKVLYADPIAKNLYKTNKALKATLVKEFGKGILDADGNISGPAAREILLSGRQNVKRVGRIVHPFVRKEINNMLARIKDKIVFVEAAIMFDSGYYTEMDYTILIYAPKELRINRAVERDGISRKEAERIIRQQMDERQKLKMADFVVRNDGKKQKLYNGLMGVLRIIESYINE